MKSSEEMIEIVNAMHLALPDEIEQEEMACIFTILLGMFGLNEGWKEIKKRVSNNVADNMSRDLEKETLDISELIVDEKKILEAKKDADDFLGRIVK